MNVSALLQQVPALLSQAIGSISLPGGAVFAPTYLQAALVVFCLFLVILTFAILRRRQSEDHIKSIMPAVAFGFTLALVLEAVLLIGGRTMFTELLGWEDAPKPISNALDASRNHLVEVLGVTDGVPESQAEKPPTVKEIMSEYIKLDTKEQENLQSLICETE